MFSLSNILGASVITLVNIYIWSKLLNIEMNFKSFKNCLLILVLMIFMILNYYYTNEFFKILSITLIMTIVCKLIFNINIKEAIITTIVSQFIIMISEFIFAGIVTLMTSVSGEDFVNSYFKNLMSNLVISLNAFMLIQFKFGKKLFHFLNKIIVLIKKYDMAILMLILIISVNFLEARIYYKIDLIWILIINTLLIIIYSFIIVKIVKTKNDYLMVFNKYNVSANSLKEYQDIVNKYRIDNHENENQLRILKNKIEFNNESAVEYINMILKTRIKDNKKILNKANVIPESDLKLLIYSKMMTMDQKNIKCFLRFDKEIKTADLIELGNDLINDICKIIGVYLDNAIEAVEELNEKEIKIELYKDNNDLFISISNNFIGQVDLNKINTPGYTTKSDGHGFGLSLVEKILCKNKKLSNQLHVNENVFKQVLKIQI